MTNTFERKDLDAVLRLEVLRNGPNKAPRFITKPVDEYTATKGMQLIYTYWKKIDIDVFIFMQTVPDNIKLNL